MARHEIPWVTVFSVHHGERVLPLPNPGYERSSPKRGVGATPYRIVPGQGGSKERRGSRTYFPAMIYLIWGKIQFDLSPYKRRGGTLFTLEDYDPACGTWFPVPGTSFPPNPS